NVRPNATETCNGIDDNCNGTTDEGLLVTFYQDADGDGYGNAAVTTQACSAPTGYVSNSTDCNDGNSNVRPNATESCTTSVDDNCNGQINENCCTVSASATTTSSSCVASANGSVNLTVSGGVAPFTFAWSNGATTEDLAAVAPGTYSVTVTDANGCTATASAVVGNLGQTVPAAPTAISGPNGVCRNSTGNVFTATPVAGATSYLWTLPTGATGSSTTNTITLSFSSTYNTGNLCVRAVTACGTSASYCRSVASYFTNPSTPGGISGPTVGVCAETIQAYSISAVSNATSYNWTAPVGATIASGQGTTNVTVSFSSTFGNNGVLSVQSVNCFGSSTNRTLTIYNIPGSPAPISGQSTSVCPGSTQTYTIAAVVGATSYVWTAPANATIASGQGTTSVTVNFASAFSTGTLSVVAASTCGQSTARTLSLTKSPSVANITGSSSNLCGGGQFTYSVTAVTGASTYNWTVPAGCSIVTNNGNSIVMNIPSTFTTGTLTLVVTNTCGVSVTKTLALTALPASPVSITGPTSVCPNQAGLMYTTPAVTGVTQQWALPTGGVITAGQGTTSMTGTWGTVAGMVTVRGINACGQSGTRGLSVSLLTCMDGDHSDDGLSRSLFMNAYPNPNDGSVVGRTSEPGRLIVLDELGRVMTEVSLSSSLG
ncbi:MAG: MopE-related protein, partial [Flavobacteriales bacterium]